MSKLKWMKWLFIMLPLTISMGPCQFASTCRTGTIPDPNDPTAVNVDFKYLRDVTLPKIHPESDLLVYIQMLPKKLPENQMEKIADETFFKKVTDVMINYPGKPGEYYEIFVIDHALASDPHTGVGGLKAHTIWLNGYLMDKVHQNSDGSECLYVKFDKNGVPHQY